MDENFKTKEFLEALLKAKGIEEINSLTSKILKKLGFAKYSYLGFNPPKVPSRTFVQSTYPSDWVEQYTKSDFIYVDPTIAFAKKTMLPFNWREPNNSKKISKPQRNFFNRGHDFGIKRGAIIPVHGPAGEFAVLALATEENNKEFEKIWADKKHDLHLIGLYYHAVVWERVLSREIEPTPSLTPRELQCLQWAARGKTNEDIATILPITQHTVRAHIKSAIVKMGTSNRVSATSKALVLGLIKL